MKPDGTGTGSSWTDATTLPNALTTATSGAKIYVTAGLYAPAYNATGESPLPAENRTKTFAIRAGVEVYGGFSDTNPEANPAARTALIPGTPSSTTLTGILNTTVAEYGAVFVRFDSFIGSPVVTSCTFTGNISETDDTGALEFNAQKSSTMTPHSTSIFTNNRSLGTYTEDTPDGPITVGTDGGAIYHTSIEGSTNNSTIVNCLFAKNLATGDGGAIYNSTFSGGTIQNTLTNSTFASNTATTEGGAIYNEEGVTLIVNNSIIWDNTSGSGTNAIAQGGTISVPPVVLINNSDVQPLDANETPNTSTASISADPLFVNAVGGNFTLQNTSPARNIGNNALYTGGSTDLGGLPRFVGLIDAGAFENQLTPCPYLPYAVNLTKDRDTPGPVTLSATGAGQEFVFTSPNGYVYSNVFRTPGVYEVFGRNVLQPGLYTLTITGGPGCGPEVRATYTIQVN